MRRSVATENESFLHHEHDKLAKSNNIQDIFIILSNYWSFLDYTLLENIIEKFGSEEDKENLERYKSEVKQFLKSCKVDENQPATLWKRYKPSTSNSVLDEQRVLLCFKLETKSLCMYYDIKSAIANIFDTNVECIVIDEIRPGCIELVFLFPRIILKAMLPLSEKIKNEFTKMKPVAVLKITIESENQKGGKILFDVSV